MQYFADVLLPLSLGKPYTYAVTSGEYEFLKPGFRVAVSFGKSKVYTAIILRLHHKAPQRYTPKFIELILEKSPSITPKQLEFWNWLSDYYQSNLGDILRAALPATFLLQSETIIVKKEISKEDKNSLSDDEFLVYEALEFKALTINEIIKILGKKSVLGLLQDLFIRGVVDIHQKLSEKYKPKLVRYVRLSNSVIESKAFEDVFDGLKNAPKQMQLLMGVFNQNPKGDQWKKSKELLDQTNNTSVVLKTLISKGLLEEQFLREDRLLYDFKKQKKRSVLSDGQNKSLNEINNAFKDKGLFIRELPVTPSFLHENLNNGD